MEGKGEKEPTFILIKEQLENYTRCQREDISSCAESCAAKSLVEKLIEIVANAEKQKEEGNGKRKREPSTSISTSLSQEVMATLQSSMERAMFTSVVVRHIFSYLDARTLLKIRQVSRLWREESTLLLLSERHEHVFIVKFEWDLEHRDKRFWHKTMSTLSEFIETCMKNSRIFPCSQFSFKGGNLSHPDLITFFSKYGHHVRYLALKPGLVKMSTLQKMLFKWTPNLTSLDFQPESWLDSEPEPESDSETGPESKKDIAEGQLEPGPRLPLNLRKISLPANPSSLKDPISTVEIDLIHKILTSAPYLTSIEDPHLAYISPIVSSGKVSLVTSLTIRWMVYRRADVEQHFLNFVAAGPKITNLTFGEFYSKESFNIRPGVVSALQRLFISCQDTLTKIEEVQGLGLMLDPHTQLCPLPKVTEAMLSWGGSKVPIPGGPGRILPEGNDLAQFLPNLKSMTVELHKWRKKFYPFLAPCDAHHSLEKLKLSNKVSKDDPQSCFKDLSLYLMELVYPFLTHLQFAVHRASWKSFYDCLGIALDEFEQVKNLVLEFWIEDDYEIGEDVKMLMDQRLTGLDSGDCDRLWSRVGNPDDSEFQEIAARIQRENPQRKTSILDLEQLISLTFEFHFQGRAQQFWTRVTQACAFQVMAERQGLQVFVQGTQKKCIPLEKNDLGPI